jgi:hypothetical protein
MTRIEGKSSSFVIPKRRQIYILNTGWENGVGSQFEFFVYMASNVKAFLFVAEYLQLSMCRLRTINNSPEEHGHALLQMSSITRLELITN